MNFSGSDILACSNPDVLKCSEDHLYETCQQIPGSKYHNYDCQQKAPVLDFAQCLNRADQYVNLFGHNRPPISKRVTYKATNYNLDLVFDDTRIYCGQFNFTYEDFYELANKNSGLICQLKHGKEVTLGILLGELYTDFSFEQSEKLDLY